MMETGLFATTVALLVVLLSVLVSAGSDASTAGLVRQKVVIGVDGGTESIRACCFDATNGHVVGEACAVPYETSHPRPGWAEQNPYDWYENCGTAVRGAVASIPSDDGPCEIVAICIDTTCCSVVALDKDGRPLMPCILWMDQRAAPQTNQILQLCKGDPALDVNCGGQGPISAEWMTPKALWIAQNEPEVWKQVVTICEYQDFMNLQLTGNIVASSCNAASRWHWNGEQCILDGGNLPGRPFSLYKTLGIPELAYKLPTRCLPMGAVLGHLSREAAEHLGIPVGTPVVQGGADAFVGMVGLGCVHPGQLCLITGSSHLHCVVTSKPTTAPGTWGSYRGAPLPGINFAEGGQSSTGSIIRWARNLFGTDISYKVLDDEAAKVPPGSDGLIALETFQGSRTPVTDPLARGAMLGLTLSHTKVHIWRALMEAVCFGTRACIEGLAAAGHPCDEIILAGGIARSPMWLQMHADVTGKPVVVCENTDAPLLGCAILASVGVGVHSSVDNAVKSMVRVSKRIEPDPVAAKEYDDIYQKVYQNVGSAVQPIAHAIQNRKKAPNAVPIRGGDSVRVLHEESGAVEIDTLIIQPEDITEEYFIREEEEGAGEMWIVESTLPPRTVISPSLLAADWTDIKGEVCRCLAAGATRLHVDVFDGVFLNSPNAMTFGPQMVQAIRRVCNEFGGQAVLDLHMCVERPERYIFPMAEAGATRFVFQWEAMDNVEAAIALAVEVASAGMSCGVSVNPSTKIEDIYPLLATNLVDLVDILAVEPGFGGQAFQRRVLDKIETLKVWREEYLADFDIMVDGGINHDTVRDVVEAGADILVSGTFLFLHPGGIERGIKSLLSEVPDD